MDKSPRAALRLLYNGSTSEEQSEHTSINIYYKLTLLFSITNKKSLTVTIKNTQLLYFENYLILKFLFTIYLNFMLLE